MLILSGPLYTHLSPLAENPKVHRHSPQDWPSSGIHAALSGHSSVLLHPPSQVCKLKIGADPETFFHKNNQSHSKIHSHIIYQFENKSLKSLELQKVNKI